jgi:hypothetical protein
LRFIIISDNKYNTNMKQPTIPLLLVLAAILLNASTAKAGFYLPEDAYTEWMNSIGPCRRHHTCLPFQFLPTPFPVDSPACIANRSAKKNELETS